MKRQISQEELADFYCLLGKAVWHFQYFEDVLVHYVTMKLKIRKPISVQEAYAILEKEQSNTMGRLLKSATQGEILPEKHKNRFNALLKERNWLVHNSWKKNGDDLYDNLKREKLFLRLEKIYQESIDLKMILFHSFEAWIAGQGLDMNRVNEVATDILNKKLDI